MEVNDPEETPIVLTILDLRKDANAIMLLRFITKLHFFLATLPAPLRYRAC